MKSDTEACGILQVQECLDALAAGKEWQSTRQPQLLEDEDATEASSSTLAPALLMRLVACSTLLASRLLGSACLACTCGAGNGLVDRL